MHPLPMSMRADLALVEVHHFPAYTSAPQLSPGLSRRLCIDDIGKKYVCGVG